MLSTLASNLGISGNDSSYSRDKPTQTRQPSRIPTRNSSYTRGEPYRDSFSRAPAYIRGSSFRDREVSRGRRIERAVDRIASPITKTTCGIGLMVDGATQTSGDVVERGVVKSEGLMGAQAQAQSEKATHASLASGIPTCGSCAGTGVDRDFNPQVRFITRLSLLLVIMRVYLPAYESILFSHNISLTFNARYPADTYTPYFPATRPTYPPTALSP